MAKREWKMDPPGVAIYKLVVYGFAIFGLIRFIQWLF